MTTTKTQKTNTTPKINRDGAVHVLMQLIPALESNEQSTEILEALAHNLALAGTLVAPKKKRYIFDSTISAITALGLYQQKGEPLSVQDLKAARIFDFSVTDRKPAVTRDTRAMIKYFVREK